MRHPDIITDMMHKPHLYVFTYSTIKKLSFNYNGSLTNSSQPYSFHVDPCRTESGLTNFRISHDILLEAAVSQLHNRIHVFTTLPDNPCFCLLLGYKHFCTISDPLLWQKSCQINEKPGWSVATCLCGMLVSMGNICWSPKLHFGPRCKLFFPIILILEKIFKESNLRSIVTHILKWLVGLFPMCNCSYINIFWWHHTSSFWTLVFLIYRFSISISKCINIINESVWNRETLFLSPIYFYFFHFTFTLSTTLWYFQAFHPM